MYTKRTNETKTLLYYNKVKAAVKWIFFTIWFILNAIHKGYSHTVWKTFSQKLFMWKNYINLKLIFAFYNGRARRMRRKNSLSSSSSYLKKAQGKSFNWVRVLFSLKKFMQFSVRRIRNKNDNNETAVQAHYHTFWW